MRKGHWPFNEGAGATATDIGGEGHDGAIVDATYTDGKRATGLNFNGTSAKVTVPHVATLNIQNAITVAAWIKGTFGATAYHYILAKVNAYRFGASSRRLYFDGPSAHYTYGAVKLTDNQWYHVAMTYDTARGSAAAGLAALNAFKELSATPVIPVGTGGDWDTTIREIGNILYDPDDVGKEYKATYTGHTGAYTLNNVTIGYAYASNPAGPWTKAGQLQLLRAAALVPNEDPYLVKVAGVYYLFVEEKTGPGGNEYGIRRWHSHDMATWTDDGFALEPQAGGTPNGWQSVDVSSPTVFIENGTWYLFYEGRGNGYIGRIGLATSTDGLSFTRVTADPIYRPVWNADLPTFDTTLNPTAMAHVPDTVVKDGDLYYMTYHGLGSLADWFEGLLVSPDLINWTPHPNTPVNPYQCSGSAQTLMLLPIGSDIFGFYYVSGSGIRRSQGWNMCLPHFYINGKRSPHISCVDTNKVALSTSTYAVGLGWAGSGTAYYFNGILDEIELFNHALSDDEVLELYKRSGKALLRNSKGVL